MKPNDMSKIIGTNIRNMRTIRHFTIQQLADLSGINAESIYKYERGERGLTVEDMLRLSDALNCSEQNFTKGLHGEARVTPKEIRRLDADEHEVLEHIATDFHGDRKALIIATGVYASIPPQRRREIILTLTMQMEDSIHCGEITAESLPRGTEYMKEALGKLFEF